MPEPVLEEMRKADFIVDVREYWGENVDDALLESLGFQTMDVKSIDPDCYQIWRKTNRPMTSVSPTLLDRIGQTDRERQHRSLTGKRRARVRSRAGDQLERRPDMDARRNQRIDAPISSRSGVAVDVRVVEGLDGSRGLSARNERDALSRPSCVIVIPCYNERRRLNADAFREFLLDHENIGFLLVNDGSTDGTRELLDELALGNPERPACAAPGA